MVPTQPPICFRRREFKGSRFRCLLLTSQPRKTVAQFFQNLTPDDVTVNSNHHWSPQGFLEPMEAQLGKTPDFLTDTQKKCLINWWLAKPGRATTPTWDLVSTCEYGEKPGLILVEAKAHEGELKDDRCGATNRDNFTRIQGALQKATDGWNKLHQGFSLSADSHYQLSNRFAFAWKLAEMGVPVVLVYLGFLNAWDMQGSGRILLDSHKQWQDCVLDRSDNHIPREAWNRTFHVNKTPLTVLIRSATVEVQANIAPS